MKVEVKELVVPKVLLPWRQMDETMSAKTKLEVLTKSRWQYVRVGETVARVAPDLACGQLSVWPAFEGDVAGLLDFLFCRYFPAPAAFTAGGVGANILNCKPSLVAPAPYTEM